MPISVQVTRGLLTPAGEREILPRVAAALLEAHGLEKNEFMKRNVIGHLVVSEVNSSYVGGRSQSLAVVEVKVPSITFRDRSVHEGFVDAVTRIVDELQAGGHPKARTFVNVTYTVDGAWGIGGNSYTNHDLASAITGPDLVP